MMVYVSFYKLPLLHIHYVPVFEGVDTEAYVSINNLGSFTNAIILMIFLFCCKLKLAILRDVSHKTADYKFEQPGLE